MCVSSRLLQVQNKSIMPMLLDVDARHHRRCLHGSALAGPHGGSLAIAMALLVVLWQPRFAFAASPRPSQELQNNPKAAQQQHQARNDKPHHEHESETERAALRFRPPAVPLIVQSPYMSLWSPADRLNEVASSHWNGDEVEIGGFVAVDVEEVQKQTSARATSTLLFQFAGKPVSGDYAGAGNQLKQAQQTSVTVNATSTTYEFDLHVDEDEDIPVRGKRQEEPSAAPPPLHVTARFTTPAFMRDVDVSLSVDETKKLPYLEALGLPITFLDVVVSSSQPQSPRPGQRKVSSVRVYVDVAQTAAVSGASAPSGGTAKLQFFPYDREEPLNLAVAGVWSSDGTPQNRTDENVDRINWGAFHVVGQQSSDTAALVATVGTATDCRKKFFGGGTGVVGRKQEQARPGAPGSTPSSDVVAAVWVELVDFFEGRGMYATYSSKTKRTAQFTFAYDEGDFAMDFYGTVFPPYWTHIAPAKARSKVRAGGTTTTLTALAPPSASDGDDEHEQENGSDVVDQGTSSRSSSATATTMTKNADFFVRASFMQKVLSRASIWRDGLLAAAAAFDAMLGGDLRKSGGPQYETLGHLVYRQCTGALSVAYDPVRRRPTVFVKEISSDGDVSTVDVIAPLAPMLLYFNPELLEHLLEPILMYANNETGSYLHSRDQHRAAGAPVAERERTDKWYNLPFAPHDLGTWPAAWRTAEQQENMPIEETGNVLILLSYLKLLSSKDSDRTTAKDSDRTTLLRTWAEYLQGALPDPDTQLCTDDFEGVTAHNANLAVKGIVGLAAYGAAFSAKEFSDSALRYGERWTQMGLASSADHYKLLLNDTESSSYSLKYNLFYQTLLQLVSAGRAPGLTRFVAPFSEQEVLRKELAFYRTQAAEYGVPMDPRARFTMVPYTGALMALADHYGDEDDNSNLYLDALFRFANRTTPRMPLTDWYDADNGEGLGSFTARPVVGGIYAKILLDQFKEHRNAGADTATSAASLPLSKYEEQEVEETLWI